MLWRVPRIWQDGDCWIIGGGFSLPIQFGVPVDLINNVCLGKASITCYSSYLKELYNKHVIGVNNAYFLGDWIDFLFFGDSSWHLKHRKSLLSWNGIKVSCAPKFGNMTAKKREGIKFLAKDKSKSQGITEKSGHVSWNGNSGAAAINLAVHLGVKRILLLGFDMNMDKYSHWFGSHSEVKSVRSKTEFNKIYQSKLRIFQRHLKGFPVIAKDAKRLGVEIININPDSAITVFSKVNLKEVL